MINVTLHCNWNHNSSILSHLFLKGNCTAKKTVMFLWLIGSIDENMTNKKPRRSKELLLLISITFLSVGLMDLGTCDATVGGGGGGLEILRIFKNHYHPWISHAKVSLYTDLQLYTSIFSPLSQMGKFWNTRTLWRHSKCPNIKL